MISLPDIAIFFTSNLQIDLSFRFVFKFTENAQVFRGEFQTIISSVKSDFPIKITFYAIQNKKEQQKNGFSHFNLYKNFVGGKNCFRGGASV